MTCRTQPGWVEAINRAGVANARRAIGGKADTYIGGSIGPGTKLPSLGHITVDALAAAYAEQIRALVEAEVDLPDHRDLPGSITDQNRHDHLL